MSADIGPSLAPVVAALETAAAGLVAATLGGALSAPRVTLDDARKGRARGRFLPGAWEDGRAEVTLPRRVLRAPAACVAELLHQLAHGACAAAGLADLAGLPEVVRVSDVRAMAECGGYHKLLFGRFLAARHRWRPATERAGHEGFVAVRQPRAAGPAVSALKKTLAAALTLHAAALPGRARSGRNYAKFVCGGCHPPRIGRFAGADALAVCKVCRRDFEPAA